MTPISAGLGIIDTFVNKFVQDKDLAEKLKHDARTQEYSGELQASLKALEAQSSIINSEASGNFLQRSWRPLTMIWFSILLGMYWFGFAPDYLIDNPATVDQLFDLLKIGIGGYIVGRSVEKTAANYKPNGN